jgi:hypothetical protein
MMEMWCIFVLLAIALLEAVPGTPFLQEMPSYYMCCVGVTSRNGVAVCRLMALIPWAGQP